MPRASIPRKIRDQIRYYFNTPEGRAARRKAQDGETIVYKQRWLRDPAEHRSHYIKAKYGLTPHDYANMLEAQGGRCAICRRTPEEAKMKRKYLSIDHDHLTGKVRGLLCPFCNTTLGKWKDSIETAQRAVDYLTKNY